MNKRRNLSVAEYNLAKAAIKKGTKTLETRRICILSDDVYLIVDYFPELDG